MKRFKIIFLCILGILLVIVFFQNTGDAPLQFLWWDWDAPAVLLYPGLFAIGFLAGVMTLLLYQRSKKKELEASAKADAVLKELEGK